MNALVRKAVIEKIRETIAGRTEIADIGRALKIVSGHESDDFLLGIAVGRIYNSFHYQTRRTLKRSATGEEFQEFLVLLRERSSELRAALAG